MRALLCLVLSLAIMLGSTANAAAVPSWGNPAIDYGAEFSRLRGDLSASGLQGIDERPAWLNRWEAYFVDALTGQTKNYLDRYDVYNIREITETDDFSDRRGYGLLPQREDVVKAFVKLANGNPEYVWHEVSRYNDVTQKGFYTLNGVAYISMNRLVELSGGAFDHLQSRVTDDPGAINGTVYFRVTPWPKITAAVVDGDTVRIEFVTYGLSSDLHRPRVTITNGVDKLDRDFGYTSQPTYHGTWTLPASEIARLGSPEQLRVVIEDGFGRTAEAKLEVLVPPLMPQQPSEGNSSDKRDNLAIFFRDLPVQADENSYVRPVKIVVLNEGPKPVRAKVRYVNRWREVHEVCVLGECGIKVEWHDEVQEKTLNLPAYSDVTWEVSAYTGISYDREGKVTPPSLLIGLYGAPDYTSLSATVSALDDISETRYDDNATSARININKLPIIKKRGVLLE